MEYCKGHRLLILALLSALYFCTAKDIDPTNEIRAEDYLQATHEEFHGIDIPKIFTVYDLNRDHKISLIELSEVTSTEKENARLPFAEADANGDNYITVEEFTDAPWLFDANDVVVTV